MKLKLEFLNEIAEKYDIGLNHFLVKTIQHNDSTEGIGRFADQYIPAHTDVAIIGGLIVNECLQCLLAHNYISIKLVCYTEQQ